MQQVIDKISKKKEKRRQIIRDIQAGVIDRLDIIQRK
jgi:hypothetical protein